MQNITDFFSQNHIALHWLGYDMSWIELLGTIFNLSAVWLSVKEKVSSWGVGIVGVILFFYLFYQIHLYADMFLQVFFFITNCIGWYQWTHPPKGFENQFSQLKVTQLHTVQRFVIGIAILFSTAALGRFFLHINEYLPQFFSQPAAFPYADSFVMAGSIFAQALLMQKKVESWALWIIVNIAAMMIYAQKEIYLTALLYFIFLGIAIKGFWDWKKELNLK